METELANWMAHEYKSAIWQLQHATDPAQSVRVKRNILGDLIKGVTGLVTHEQFTVEHKEQHRKDQHRKAHGRDVT